MIKLSQACIGAAEQEAVCRVLEKLYLGMGEEVRFFEQEIQSFIGSNVEVACVNTGTSALQLAVQACGIGPGDEVIVPTLTYVASFQAISATGATPIACDVDMDTGFMDVQDAETKITKKTKAFMPVHYASGYGNLAAVYALAEKHELRVIEDAAHSFGGKYKNHRVGAQGDIICFSFDGIKNITCGEGGAVVSKDTKIINKVRDLRLLAVEGDTKKRYDGKRSWDFDVKEQGWRCHMSNMNAAIGRVQLKRVDDFAKIRQNLWKKYTQLLNSVPVNCIPLDSDNCVPHMFPIKVQADKRDALREYLMEHSIETGLHYKPNHLLTKYAQPSCSNAEKLWKELITLPLHCNLKEEDIILVSQKIKDFFQND